MKYINLFNPEKSFTHFNLTLIVTWNTMFIEHAKEKYMICYFEIFVLSLCATDDYLITETFSDWYFWKPLVLYSGRVYKIQELKAQDSISDISSLSDSVAPLEQQKNLFSLPRLLLFRGPDDLKRLILNNHNILSTCVHNLPPWRLVCTTVWVSSWATT